MKPTLQTIIMGGLGFALALLLAVAVVSFRSTVQLTEDMDGSQHTQEVLTQLAALLATITDAESGARGYVITGDTLHLDPYQAAVARINSEFQQLRQFTADNPHQQQRLDTLAPLLTMRLAHIQETIELRQTRGFTEAQRVTATGRGKQIHDAIRQVIADANQEENQLLVQRDAQARDAAHLALVIIVTGGVGMLLLVGAMLVIIHRDFAARRHQEERFSRVVEATPNGIVTANEAGIITLVNAQTEKLFGYARAELIGQPVEVLVPERFRAAHPAHRRSFFADSKTRAMGAGRDLFGRRKDGSEFPLEVGLSPIVMREGAAVLATLVDITKRKQAEDQLNRFFTLSLDLLCIASADGYFKRISPAFTETLGWSTEEILARPFLDFVHPDDRAATLREVERQVVGGESVLNFENRYLHKDGSWRVLSWKSVPYAGGFMFATARDVTARKQAEEALLKLNQELRLATEKAQAADRVKSEFLDTVSHELRTPLASLLGFSELMLTRTLPEEKRRHFVEVIHAESQRLNTLINDFLDLQRLESGRVRFERAPLDVASLLRDAAMLFSNHPQHPLRSELPDDLPPVYADHDRLKQVLNNLLSNAIKFSPQGGEIVLAARATGAGSIEFAIQDRGLGIPAEEMPNLFGKFFRVDSTDRREIGGTGLGLALCKEIVTAHGGKIWVESVLRQGSTFRFTLPVAESVLPPANVLGPFDALVIEDDIAFAILVREHLGEFGLRVRIEPTAEGALAALRTTLPRLILLDIHLAGTLDGWDFLTAVKSDPRLAPIPIIVTTITEERPHGLALGASDYLVKPFPMASLLALVRRYLPRPEGGAALVADDDATFRHAVAEALRIEFDCAVEEAADGREALDQIARVHPGLIVLDLLMPNVDGFEVLDRLRLDPRTATLPVLVMTGKDLTAADKQRLKHGMAHVLTKAEYKREQLLALVRQLLGSAPRT